MEGHEARAFWKGWITNVVSCSEVERNSKISTLLEHSGGKVWRHGLAGP